MPFTGSIVLFKVEPLTKNFWPFNGNIFSRTTPSELKCCFESLCDVSVVEPAEEGKSGYVVKNNLKILMACFAFAYKTFI